MDLDRQTESDQPVVNGEQEGVLPGAMRHPVDHLQPVGRESQIFPHILSVQQSSSADVISQTLMVSAIELVGNRVYTITSSEILCMTGPEWNKLQLVLLQVTPQRRESSRCASPLHF